MSIRSNKPFSRTFLVDPGVIHAGFVANVLYCK